MSVNSVDFNAYSASNKKLLANEVSNAYSGNFAASNPSVNKDTFSRASNPPDSAEDRGSVNSWVNEKIGYKTGCTDSNNDGKLSFGDKLKSIGRGVLNFVTNIVESVKERPIQTLLTVGAVIAGSAAVVAAGIISAPALAIGGAAIGLIGGAASIVKGISKASKAETDAEAKQAYESIGEGGATVAVSAFTMGKGIKTYKNNLSTARTSAAESATSAKESANNAAKSASKANEALGSATKSAESASTSAATATNAADDASTIAAQFTDDAIKESNILTENAAQNARSASKTAQEALKNTKNSAGMSSSAAEDAAQYAKEAADASEKANQTWSLARAQKAAKAGTNATQGAKGAAKIAASSADDALKSADGAAKAASDASKYADDALKSLDSTKEIAQSLSVAETGNTFTASLEELKQGAKGVKLSSKQKSALKYKGELVIEQEGSAITIKKSSANDLYEVSIVENNIQKPINGALSDRQVKALGEYVYESHGYEVINKGTEALAKGSPIDGKTKRLVDDLTELIASQEPLEAGTKVYRTEGYEVFDQIKLTDGTKLSDAMKQAAESGDANQIAKIKAMLANGEFDKVKQPHFLSTSLSPDGTFSTKGEVLWESVVTEGSKGVRAEVLLDYINPENAVTPAQIRRMDHMVQYITREKEILFQRGSDITITGLDYDYNKAKWVLQGIIKN